MQEKDQIHVLFLFEEECLASSYCSTWKKQHHCTWERSQIPKPQVYVSHASLHQDGLSLQVCLGHIKLWLCKPFLGKYRLSLFSLSSSCPKIKPVCYGDGEKNKLIFLNQVYCFRFKVNLNSTSQQVTVVVVFLDIGEIWTSFLTASTGQVFQLQDK